MFKLGTSLSVSNPSQPAAEAAPPPADGHQFWRLNVADAAGEVGLEWSALKIYENGDEISNNTLDVTVSSTFGGYDAIKILTPQASPGWASTFNDTWPQTYAIDFGIDVLPDELKLTPVVNARAPGVWTWEWSDNGTDWTIYATFNTPQIGWSHGVERTLAIVPDP